MGVEVADVVRALAFVVWVVPAWVRTLKRHKRTMDIGVSDPPTEGGPMIQNRT